MNPSEKLKEFLTSPADSYAILQLKEIDEVSKQLFSSMKELERMGMKPEFSNYEVIYTGPLQEKMETAELLESLYVKFNYHHPGDYHGRSLSVSDVVALKRDGVVSAHYVDWVGFQKLPDFIPQEQYLKNAEMQMEDDYGMLDGIINNGAKDQEHRPSLLAQLREQSPAPSKPHPARSKEQERT